MKRTSLDSRGRDGFTLVEMLTVLVLMGIMAAMVAPSMSGMVAVGKAERARDQLIADISYARMQAVRSGQRTAICLAADASYRVWRGVSAASPCGSGTLIRTVQLASEYSGVSTTPAAGNLVFDSRGLLLPGSQVGTLEVAAGAHRTSFLVTAIGSIQRND